MQRLYRDTVFVVGVVALAWFVSAYGHSRNRLARTVDRNAWEEIDSSSGTSELQSSGSVAVPKALAKAPIEMQRLAWLVGKWRSEESYGPGKLAPSSGIGDRTEEVKVGGEGLSLVADYGVRNPHGTFTGHEVIEYDRETGGYNISGSDKASPSPWQWHLRGDWDSEALIFYGTAEREGRKLAMKLLYYDIGAKSFTMVLYLGEDPSHIEPVMTGQYSRAE
jgi:hypothetical protein